MIFLNMFYSSNSFRLVKSVKPELHEKEILIRVLAMVLSDLSIIKVELLICTVLVIATCIGK